MADQRVFVGDLTRKEFRERMEAGTIKAAVVPTAATEQHNEHLEMIHDSLHATYMAEQAATRLHPQVVVATPIQIGVSEHWMAHKGTLTVRPEIFCEYVYDVCHSLQRAGIENILILNGHGGNVAPLEAAMRQWKLYFQNTHPDAGIHLHSYWQSIPPDFAKQVTQGGRFPGHAGEFETSFALHAFPETVRVDHLRDTEDPEPATATSEKGRLLVEKAIDGLAELLRDMQRSRP